VKYLSADQVFHMHEKLLEKWGGMSGGGHRGVGYEGVEAAVQAVKNSYYTNVKELAAAYAVYIVQGHVFADGNKRTAEAAMMTFLEYNTGKTSSKSMAEDMILLQLRAESNEDTTKLVHWLARRL
jgi:death on curing protein